MNTLSKEIVANEFKQPKTVAVKKNFKLKPLADRGGVFLPNQAEIDASSKNLTARNLPKLKPLHLALHNGPVLN